MRNFAATCTYLTISESVSSFFSVKRAWCEYTVCVGGIALAYFEVMQPRISCEVSGYIAVPLVSPSRAVGVDALNC